MKLQNQTTDNFTRFFKIQRELLSKKFQNVLIWNSIDLFWIHK